MSDAVVQITEKHTGQRVITCRTPDEVMQGMSDAYRYIRLRELRRRAKIDLSPYWFPAGLFVGLWLAGGH